MSELSRFSVGWSADTRWIAWAQDQDNRNSALALYDCKSNSCTRSPPVSIMTSSPCSIPMGNICSSARGAPSRPATTIWTRPGFTPTPPVLAAVPLRKDVLSPLAPRNDEEGDKTKDKKEDSEKKKDDDKTDKPKDASKTDKQKDDGNADKQKDDRKADKKKEDEEGRH